MYILVQKKWPIVYFDATGNICKKIENQKIPYFYTMTFHDRENKSIIPLADFITTSQTTISVITFLNEIKYYLQKYHSLCNAKFKPLFEVPPIFVMDRSWVLINSHLDVFCGINIQELLRITYECLQDGDFRNFHKVKSFPYWDSVHLMTGFIKKTKKIKHFEIKFEKMAKKFSVFCFCLLQSTTSLEEFQNLFVDIFNVFNQENKNEIFINSIVNIEHQIVNRNVSPRINLDLGNSINKHEKVELSKNECRPFTRSQMKNISKTSPFKVNFDKLIRTRCRKIKYDANVETNCFYNPAIFDLFKQHLPYLPLWTGCFLSIMKEKFKNLHLCQLDMKRLDSNPAEGNFNILKNKILLKSGAMPSEICALSYERLLFKFERDYSKRIDSEISPNLTISKDKDELSFGELNFFGNKRKKLQDFFENEFSEKWGPTKKQRKYTTSYFYGNKSNISYLDLASSVDYNKDFAEIFSGKIFF